MYRVTIGGDGFDDPFDVCMELPKSAVLFAIIHTQLLLCCAFEASRPCFPSLTRPFRFSGAVRPHLVSSSVLLKPFR